MLPAETGCGAVRGALEGGGRSRPPPSSGQDERRPVTPRLPPPITPWPRAVRPDLGMVRRSPEPLPWCGSCRANQTSSSFSVPSKKCAPLSFMVRQGGNRQRQKGTAATARPARARPPRLLGAVGRWVEEAAGEEGDSHREPARAGASSSSSVRRRRGTRGAGRGVTVRAGVRCGAGPCSPCVSPVTEKSIERALANIAGHTVSDQN